MDVYLITITNGKTLAYSGVAGSMSSVRGHIAKVCEKAGMLTAPVLTTAHKTGSSRTRCVTPNQADTLWSIPESDAQRDLQARIRDHIFLVDTTPLL